jgi:hypothetical protein
MEAKTMYTILSLIILVLDIWALVQVWKGTADNQNKILWTVVIVLLPILGLIGWYVWGRGK